MAEGNEKAHSSDLWPTQLQDTSGSGMGFVTEVGARTADVLPARVYSCTHLDIRIISAVYRQTGIFIVYWDNEEIKTIILSDVFL